MNQSRSKNIRSVYDLSEFSDQHNTRQLYGQLKRSESLPSIRYGDVHYGSLFGKHSFNHKVRLAGDKKKSMLFLEQRIEKGVYGQNIVCMGTKIKIIPRIRKIEIVDHRIACPHRLIVHPVTIAFSSSSHANIVIVDKEQQIVERFEPHGFRTYDFHPPDSKLYALDIIRAENESSVEIDAYLKKWAKEMYPNFRYLSPFDVCPSLGPQSRATEELSEFGFCQTWVLLYADARLKNYNQSPEYIQRALLDYSPDQLHDLVRTFASIVDNETVDPDYEPLNIKTALAEKSLMDSLLDVIDQFPKLALPNSKLYNYQFSRPSDRTLIYALKDCAKFFSTRSQRIENDKDEKRWRTNFSHWKKLIQSDTIDFNFLKDFSYLLRIFDDATFLLDSISFELALVYAEYNNLREDISQICNDAIGIDVMDNDSIEAFGFQIQKCKTENELYKVLQFLKQYIENLI